MSVPELPGHLIPRHSPHERWLKGHVARMCGLDHERFPGSQPVSFSSKDLQKLESHDFWVCEKSDGIRVLFLVVLTPDQPDEQVVFLIDRHNTYRQILGFVFPHHENPRNLLRNTLIDGELVLDVDPVTKKETMCFLAFDCLVIDDQNVMTKTLDKRYGRLQEWWYKPYMRMLRDHPHTAETQPFAVKIKDISLSYHVEKVFNVDIPNLHHGNDGLIYTCVNTPYTPGTDNNILKWKPPSENSIDFKLVLRFPPLASNPREPDFHAKPLFLLHIWCGDDRGVPRYEQYDDMYVDDEEWERMKLSGEQIDDRIVEVHWDFNINRWRMMRFRDDKPHGNHKSVVDKIINSIADGVEKDALLARSTAIRNAWKMRQGQPPGPPPQQGPPLRGPPLQQQQHHQPPPQHQQQPKRPPLVPPNVEIRYGPLAKSPWSKVAGPTMIAGMMR
ncbi:mRNA guanylyltransferase [Coprinopsis cinerea okayama7|uniref:mRNA-capping enzyme subunit alpha n=1 Tax=Coprinopsis cinerea (strain Okayama-7 / 130 / ATCC MYA-4618 / FGSC 9003) TaxID=240176 RepID=A8NE70_COPC7|nr:mRNA guanylyltransferase [Coprinopsis cinerea okayama7\|eukprot:XP_001832948.1 mRNA guanylyltransferase [Coprinopsis cinerea okayama7\